MSLLEGYRSSLIKPGDGSVNPELQEANRLKSTQMRMVYTPMDFPKPKKRPEFSAAMPSSILRIRLSWRIRRMLFDPDNRWIWNRINRRPN